MTEQPVRQMAHHPGLDGVRASALIMIMLFHADPSWIPGGFISVSLFFTLSGYLITSLLVFEGEANGRISLRRFWSRRLRRLAPAALVSVAVIVGLSTWLSSTVEQGRVRGDAVAATAYVANWRSITAGHSYAELFADASPLQHLWSLSIEEQLYFLVPLVVAVGFAAGLRRRGIGWVFVVLSAVSVLVSVLVDGQDRIYYGTDTRAVELFVGAAMACFLGPRLEIWARARFRWPLVLLVSPLVLFVVFSRLVDFRSEWLYEGFLGSFALLNVVFCIGAVVPGPMRWIMSLPPLQLMGRTSYGIYLVHWPVYVWVDEDLTGLRDVPLLGVRMLVTFALAAVMFRLVEKPIRYQRILTSNRRALAVFVASFVFVLALPVAVLPASSNEISTEQEVLSTVPRAEGEVAGPINVLVIGDSSSINVALALSNGADGRLGVISAGVIGCPLMKVDLVFRRIDENQETTYCPDNLDIIRDNLAAIDAVLVVASVANQWDYHPVGSTERVVQGSDRHRADMDRFIEAVGSIVRPTGTPILFLESPLVTDEPMMNGDRPEDRDVWNSIMDEWDDRYDWVKVVPYDDLLADPYTEQGRAERPDGTHIDESFGEAMARASLVPRVLQAYSKTVDDIN